MAAGYVFVGYLLQGRIGKGVFAVGIDSLLKERFGQLNAASGHILYERTALQVALMCFNICGAVLHRIFNYLERHFAFTPA